MEEDFLEATKGKNIDLFVSSDAEAILGIGDQGVGVRVFVLPSSVTTIPNGITGYRCMFLLRSFCRYH